MYIGTCSACRWPQRAACMIAGVRLRCWHWDTRPQQATAIGWCAHKTVHISSRMWALPFNLEGCPVCSNSLTTQLSSRIPYCYFDLFSPFSYYGGASSMRLAVGSAAWEQGVVRTLTHSSFNLMCSLPHFRAAVTIHKNQCCQCGQCLGQRIALLHTARAALAFCCGLFGATLCPGCMPRLAITPQTLH